MNKRHFYFQLYSHVVYKLKIWISIRKSIVWIKQTYKLLDDIFETKQKKKSSTTLKSYEKKKNI